MGSAEESTVLVVPAEYAQKIRFELEKLKLWDATHKLKKLADSDHIAIPVIVNDENISLIAEKWPDFRVARTCLPISKKMKVKQSSPAVRLRDEIQQLVTLYGMPKELLKEVPSKWERHGDLGIIPAQAFSSPKWAAIGDQLWEVVANCLACKRLARHSAVANNGFRSSRVIMLLGQNGEVTHVDNGIRYTYDVTKCMFSSGNITEKLRVASLDCTQEIVVDLYAGIGYFTLPYLVHAGACHVHACEWNPDAIVALKRNLLINGVAERCTIHEGDNRKLQLLPLADRVNLGLIPSSEGGWPVAVQVLKMSGGILHIHGNVSTLPDDETQNKTRETEKEDTILHDEKEMDDKNKDLHDKLPQITASLSETESCQLQSSQQMGEKNVLLTDGASLDLSYNHLEDAAMNTSELNKKVKVMANGSGSLENCKNFRADSDISDLSDSYLHPVGDVSSEPENCTLCLPRDSLQHTNQRWPHTSSHLVAPQFDCLENDHRQNVQSRDRKHVYLNTKDGCQATHHSCTDDTYMGLDKTSQNRDETNILLASERWSQYVQRQIRTLLKAKKGGTWTVTKLHLEIVKSYAPHIFHVVLDLECRPV